MKKMTEMLKAELEEAVKNQAPLDVALVRFLKHEQNFNGVAAIKGMEGLSQKEMDELRVAYDTARLVLASGKPFSGSKSEAQLIAKEEARKNILQDTAFSQCTQLLFSGDAQEDKPLFAKIS